MEPLSLPSQSESTRAQVGALLKPGALPEAKAAKTGVSPPLVKTGATPPPVKTGAPPPPVKAGAAAAGGAELASPRAAEAAQTLSAGPLNQKRAASAAEPPSDAKKARPSAAAAPAAKAKSAPAASDGAGLLLAKHFQACLEQALSIGADAKEAVQHIPGAAAAVNDALANVQKAVAILAKVSRLTAKED